MKISFQNNVIGLSAETPEEWAICALLAGADRHVFQLHAATGRGMVDIWMRIRTHLQVEAASGQ